MPAPCAAVSPEVALNHSTNWLSVLELEVEPAAGEVEELPGALADAFEDEDDEVVLALEDNEVEADEALDELEDDDELLFPHPAIVSINAHAHAAIKIFFISSLSLYV